MASSDSFCQLVAIFLCLATSADTFTETPKFSQLRLLYPGYPQYGGHYTQERLLEFIVGPESNATGLDHVHHSTAAVRLSWTLNRYGGRHAIGTEPVHLSTVGRDSFTGRDGQQYIHRNVAFGPFLAARYGNPLVSWGIDRSPSSGSQTMAHGETASTKNVPLTTGFRGRQGIVRVVSYKRHHEDGHVGLWDCTRFHESRDWTNETHVIAVEFWEASDSYCPPEEQSRRFPRPSAHLEPASGMQIIPRDSIGQSVYLHEQVDDDERKFQHNQHQHNHNHHHQQQQQQQTEHRGHKKDRGKKISDVWIQ